MLAQIAFGHMGAGIDWTAVAKLMCAEIINGLHRVLRSLKLSLCSRKLYPGQTYGFSSLLHNFLRSSDAMAMDPILFDALILLVIAGMLAQQFGLQDGCLHLR